jgi:hypothetical protein
MRDTNGSGHFYELANDQRLVFLEKEAGQIIHDGTTNEELLEVLVDRITKLNAKFPCRENSIAITKIQEALHWLEARTKDRVKRGVEGMDLK